VNAVRPPPHDRLELRESPWLIRAAALFISSVGTFFVIATVAELDRVSPPTGWTRWGIAAIGAGAMLAAPAVWRRAPDRRVIIDRDLRVVRIIDRSHTLPVDWTLRFDEIADVETESVKDDEDHIVFRPVLRLANGGALPLRNSFSSDLAREEATAASVRAVFGPL
jgi:hypothetical protein